MSRGGIIIQNRADGRGMMLPEREGSGTFNKLPFVSMSCPKEEIGINPISTNKIIKTRKVNPIIKRDRKKEIEDKLYPLENYRQLKTAQQFWKKNENPIYKEYNKNNAFQMFNKNIVKKEENKNTITITNKETTNKEKEEVGNLSLKIKTPQKLKPIINKTTINAKRKIFDERKNDETTPVKEIKEIKEEKNEQKIENNNSNNCNNDKDNKIENKENNDKKEEDVKDKIDPLLDDDLNENENIEDVINYLNGLDYDKYCKDMEIREALTLLKNKIDKEKEEKDKEEEKNKNKVTVEGVEQNEEAEKKGEEEEKKDDNNEENKDNKQLILPEINKKISEQKPVEIVNEEELKRKEEIKKYKYAEQIAKTEQMKAVHSVNSIRKLLQREDLDKVEEVAPLKITVSKDNPIANSDEYQANKLPFLHSLPLV